MKAYLIAVLALCPCSVPAEPDCIANDLAPQFFDTLSGPWEGEAVTTPVGPRPYDITFERREDAWIYGRADPGAAIHHWGFYCQEGELRLRFLSTFGGNQDPILLKATRVTPDRVHFQAADPAFLAVQVRPGARQSQLEVLHHGKRHVLIELERRPQR